MLVGELIARLSLDRSTFDRGLDEAEAHATSKASLIANALKGAVLGGIAAIGGGFIAAGAAGLGFNNQMEQVRAKIGAFTKDAGKTEEILGMVQRRAASTPFEFNAMAEAAAALIPSANQSGAALEDLIAQAEILAASNPAEGLEGAAFALKEAVSGDFTSVIERFNLPRQRLNELKEQGVPALEAVRIAMGELGLDAELVTNLAGTLEGRWSTFKDTLVSLAATATQPIFDALSGGLAGVNEMLTASQPQLQALADQLAGGITTGIQFLSGTAIPALADGWMSIQPSIRMVMGWFAQTGDASDGLGSALGWMAGVWVSLRELIGGMVPPIQAIVLTAFGVIQAFLRAHGAEIRATIRTAWDAIGMVVTLTIQLLNATILPALRLIASFISAHSSEILAVLSAAWTMIQSVIKIALAIITGLLSAALAVMRGDWQGAWDAIYQMLQTVWANIQIYLSAALDALTTLLSLAWAGITTAASAAWNALWSSTIQPAVNTITSGVTGTIDTLKRDLDTAWGSIKTGAESAWRGIASGISSAFSGAVGGIKGTLNEMIGKVNSAIEGFNKLPGPDIPKIPKLAKGTSFFQGGLALVGEEGPELVAMPRGSQVFTARETRGMMGGSPGPTHIYYPNATFVNANVDQSSLDGSVALLQMLGSAT